MPRHRRYRLSSHASTCDLNDDPLPGRKAEVVEFGGLFPFDCIGQFSWTLRPLKSASKLRFRGAVYVTHGMMLNYWPRPSMVNLSLQAVAAAWAFAKFLNPGSAKIYQQEGGLSPPVQ